MPLAYRHSRHVVGLTFQSGRLQPSMATAVIGAALDFQSYHLRLKAQPPLAVENELSAPGGLMVR